MFRPFAARPLGSPSLLALVALTGCAAPKFGGLVRGRVIERRGDPEGGRADRAEARRHVPDSAAVARDADVARLDAEPADVRGAHAAPRVVGIGVRSGDSGRAPFARLQSARHRRAHGLRRFSARPTASRSTRRSTGAPYTLWATQSSGAGYTEDGVVAPTGIWSCFECGVQGELGVVALERRLHERRGQPREDDRAHPAGAADLRRRGQRRRTPSTVGPQPGRPICRTWMMATSTLNGGAHWDWYNTEAAVLFNSSSLDGHSILKATLQFDPEGEPVHRQREPVVADSGGPDVRRRRPDPGRADCERPLAAVGLDILRRRHERRPELDERRDEPRAPLQREVHRVARGQRLVLLGVVRRHVGDFQIDVQYL